MPLIDINNIGTGGGNVANPLSNNPTINPVTNNNSNSIQPVKPSVVSAIEPIQKNDPQKIPNIVNNNVPQGTQYDLSMILEEAVKSNASDVHLTLGYRAILRVEGNLIQLATTVLNQNDLKTFANEILKSRPDFDLSKLSEIDLSYSFKDRRFRVNIFKEIGGIAIVMRLVPKDILSIDDLGLPPVFKEFAKIPAGLILVTGPTGSGKSTTLASILNHINSTQSKHIVTLEDPIEFVYEKKNSLIEQREFGIDFDSWPNALKSLLRQDPNVVLVGEMRDYETIASTITVSETGHLVFATLHTNSASQSIDRIIDVFPENQQGQVRSQLANVIVAVVSQRLVKLKSGKRRSVMELMVANPAVKNSIRESKTYQIDNMIQTGQDYGMVSMEKSLAELVKKGEITLDAAMQTTVKPKELEILLNK